MTERFWSRLTHALYGALIFFYLFAFPYHPRVDSPNELCRLWQTRSLVEHGTLHIDPSLADYPRRRIGDLSIKDGKHYPSKAPLLSFAALPIYKVLSLANGGDRYAVDELKLVYWPRLFLTVLPTLLCLLFLRRFLRTYLSVRLSDALVLTYGMGSLALSYSLLFMSHQTTSVLAFFAFYALWRTLRRDFGTWGFFVAGGFAGATVATEYTGALEILALMAYAVISVWREGPQERWKRLSQGAGLAVLGALPFVLGLMAYHQAAFGHPLESGYKHLNDEGYKAWHQGGFLGIRLPDGRAFLLSFFSPLRGFFALAPFLLPSVWGLVRWAREKAKPEPALFWLSSLMPLGYTYFTSSFTYDSWGWSTGPRHLTGLVPFLLLPLGLWLQGVKEEFKSVAGGVQAGLCTASILITGLLSLVNYIPDDVSEAVWGLALPLFRDGYFTPTLLNVYGSTRLSGGIALLAALIFCALGAGALLLSELKEKRERLLGATAAVCVALLALGFHAASYQARAQDLGAQQFLKSIWLLQPKP